MWWCGNGTYLKIRRSCQTDRHGRRRDIVPLITEFVHACHVAIRIDEADPRGSGWHAPQAVRIGENENVVTPRDSFRKLDIEPAAIRAAGVKGASACRFAEHLIS